MELIKQVTENRLENKIVNFINHIEPVTKERLPDICLDILTYKVFYNLLALTIISAILIVCWQLFKKSRKMKQSNNSETFYDGNTMQSIVLIITFFASSVFVYCFIEITKILFLPKVFLIEYFSNLL